MVCTAHRTCTPLPKCMFKWRSSHPNSSSKASSSSAAVKTSRQSEIFQFKQGCAGKGYTEAVITHGAMSVKSVLILGAGCSVAELEHWKMLGR